MPIETRRHQVPPRDTLFLLITIFLRKVPRQTRRDWGLTNGSMFTPGCNASPWVLQYSFFDLPSYPEYVGLIHEVEFHGRELISIIKWLRWDSSHEKYSIFVPIDIINKFLRSVPSFIFVSPPQELAWGTIVLINSIRWINVWKWSVLRELNPEKVKYF